jgi:hypothetical protein
MSVLLGYRSLELLRSKGGHRIAARTLSKSDGAPQSSSRCSRPLKRPSKCSETRLGWPEITPPSTGRPRAPVQNPISPLIPENLHVLFLSGCSLLYRASHSLRARLIGIAASRATDTPCMHEIRPGCRIKPIGKWAIKAAVQSFGSRDVARVMLGGVRYRASAPASEP